MNVFLYYSDNDASDVREDIKKFSDALKDGSFNENIRLNGHIRLVKSSSVTFGDERLSAKSVFDCDFDKQYHYWKHLGFIFPNGNATVIQTRKYDIDDARVMLKKAYEEMLARCQMSQEEKADAEKKAKTSKTTNKTNQQKENNTMANETENKNNSKTNYNVTTKLDMKQMMQMKMMDKMMNGGEVSLGKMAMLDAFTSGNMDMGSVMRAKMTETILNKLDKGGDISFSDMALYQAFNSDDGKIDINSVMMAKMFEKMFDDKPATATKDETDKKETKAA